ncbi:MAG TPA: isoprenylcysteine carboxylmethyltransferase family protein [Anaerolineaceae bacterium]|nr:isoprenylcysteine carboxylmethyltransferase family protein [Anaerolineaceae bacterium]
MNLPPFPGTGFWWVLLAVALYGLLHSFLASHTAKRLAARIFGAALTQRYYRLFFALQAGLTFLPALALAWRLPDRRLWAIPMPWLAVTMLVQGLAVLGLLAGVAQTGAGRFVGLEQALDPDSANRPPQLVASGFYRWVRHPLYLFGILLIWLLPVMSANLLALNLGVTAYLVLGTIPEERKLRQELGPPYEAYRRRTPWLVPWPRRRDLPTDYAESTELEK